MVTEVLNRTYTVEEFLNLDLPEDGEYELIEGEIVAKREPDAIGPSGKHGEIIGNFYPLKQFAAERRLGRVFYGAACNLLTSYVIPDVAFVSLERLPREFDGPVPVVPDLIIEVNSPTDDTKKIHQKVTAYLNAGVRLVWSVYLLDKFILVHRPNTIKPTLLGLDDELDGENIIPGFKLAVNKVFDFMVQPENLPS